MKGTNAAVVFVHGLAADRTVWWPVMDSLTDAIESRCYSTNLPGHGGAATVDKPSFGLYAAMVAGEIDHAEEEVYVVGHSLGALVAAVMSSGLFGIGVKGFVGIAPKVTWTADEISRSQRRADQGRRFFPRPHDAWADSLNSAGEGPVADGQSLERLRVMRHPDGGYSSVFDPASSPTNLLGENANATIGRVLRQVPCPMRLIVGSDDPGVGVRELQNYDADAVEISGLGHNPHIAAPHVVSELIREFVESSS